MKRLPTIEEVETGKNRLAETDDDRWRAWQAEYVSRVVALLETLGKGDLEDDDTPAFWYGAFIALAERHVPAFIRETDSRGGAPTKWTPLAHLKLRALIDTKKSSGGHSLQRAAELVAKQHGSELPGGNGATLRRRYYSSVKADYRITIAEQVLQKKHGPEWRELLLAGRIDVSDSLGELRNNAFAANIPDLFAEQ